MKDTVMYIGNWVVNIYLICIFIYVFSSWIPALRQNAIGKLIAKMVEPYLNLFRFIPPIGMIDISPMIAIYAFYYLSNFLLKGLSEVLNFFV